MKQSLRFPVSGIQEWLAWIVLALSLVLFTVTVSLAQPQAPQPPEPPSGRVHLKLEKEENGQWTRIDTTFDLSNLDRMHEMLRSFDSSLDPGEDIDFSDGGRMEKIFRHRQQALSREDQEKLDTAMEQLRQRMKELRQEMRKLRFEWHADSGSALPRPGDFHWQDDAGTTREAPHDNSSRRYRQCLRIMTDSLDGSGGSIILEGADGERQVIRLDEDGDDEKIIIIRKSRGATKHGSSAAPAARQPSAARQDALPVRGMKVYPNPGDGRLTVTFRLDREGDAVVKITDTAGKSVFREKLKGFSGIYEKQLDLSGEGSGTYTLSVTQDGKSATKKFVIE